MDNPETPATLYKCTQAQDEDKENKKHHTEN